MVLYNATDVGNTKISKIHIQLYIFNTIYYAVYNNLNSQQQYILCRILPSILSSILPVVFNFNLRLDLTLCFQVNSQYTHQYPIKFTSMYTSELRTVSSSPLSIFLKTANYSLFSGSLQEYIRRSRVQTYKYQIWERLRF